MDHYTLVQDFVVLLLAAGLAGMLCKRVGLSAIVGYLLAGIVIGPYSLAQLQIPARFGCFVVEVERNNFALTHPSPDLACFAGDRLLLLGRAAEIDKARAFLEGGEQTNGHIPDFDRAVLESFIVPRDAPTGRPLGELQIARKTGVRLLGIARANEKILVPQANEVLRPGDQLLGLGTLDQLQQFRSWLGTTGAKPALS